MVCGFSCEDLISMFKELKTLGVVVKELSNELRQLVRSSKLLLNGLKLAACSLQSLLSVHYLGFHHHLYIAVQHNNMRHSAK